MTPKERAAMQQALESLEQYQFDYCWDSKVNATITALREALAEQADMNLNCKSVQARLATSWGYVKDKQAEQEPVAYAGMLDGSVCAVYTQWPVSHYHKIKPLYAAPVRTKDLTDEEIREVLITFDRGSAKFDPLEEFRAVIAADREKNK